VTLFFLHFSKFGWNENSSLVVHIVGSGTWHDWHTLNQMFPFEKGC